VLLGDGGLLLCSGGVFFGVRSGGNDIFDIYDCCYAADVFSLVSVLGALLGNDTMINFSISFICYRIPSNAGHFCLYINIF
jgi:hypothetical protein